MTDRVDSMSTAEIFSWLVDRGVFRPGVVLPCPYCQLESWYSIDELQLAMACNDCGRRFNPSAHLHQKEWRYRRSGLFGRDDHQEGGIAVSLALRRLTNIPPSIDGSRTIGYMAGLDLGGQFGACESDLVVLAESGAGQPQIVVGECKSRGKVTEDDVAKMSAVADAFRLHGLRAFIVFAKASSFEEDEIHLFKDASSNRAPRLIILDQTELERSTWSPAPEGIPERLRNPLSLERMAEASDALFLNGPV